MTRVNPLPSFAEVAVADARQQPELNIPATDQELSEQSLKIVDEYDVPAVRSPLPNAISKMRRCGDLFYDLPSADLATCTGPIFQTWISVRKERK
ncbi:hypothetical protein [Trueperella pyogenes]|uniref:hypothetical protein n=1 Tax=Trueperella pyogenes TaxID=1661 RepID=UPI0024BF47E9|nr:hypothetical protein [Trueperella pyogenes]WHU57781.1 hypothetical protein QEV10_03545 [Trueperella pyogenes]